MSGQHNRAIYRAKQVGVGSTNHGEISVVVTAGIVGQEEVRRSEGGDDLWEIHHSPLGREEGQRVGCSPRGLRRRRIASEQKPAVVGEAVGHKSRHGGLGAPSASKGRQCGAAADRNDQGQHQDRPPLGAKFGPRPIPDESHDAATAVARCGSWTPSVHIHQLPPMVVAGEFQGCWQHDERARLGVPAPYPPERWSGCAPSQAPKQRSGGIDTALRPPSPVKRTQPTPWDLRSAPYDENLLQGTWAPRPIVNLGSTDGPGLAPEREPTAAMRNQRETIRESRVVGRIRRLPT